MGALVAEVVPEALAEVVAEPLVVREAEVVDARVCELNVVLRDTGTPVPIEAPGPTEVTPMDVMVEFIDAVRVDVPE